MKAVNPFFRILNKTLSVIIFPLKTQWPFIIVMTLLGALFASYMVVRAVLLPAWPIAFWCSSSSFFIAYCLSCTFAWLPGRWRTGVKIFWYIIGFAMCIIDFIGDRVFGMPISFRMYMLMVETTGEETAGFFKMFGPKIMTYGLILLAILGLILFCLERYQKKIKSWFRPWLKMVCYIVFFVLMTFGAIQALSPFKILCKHGSLEGWAWNQAANGRLEFMNTWHKCIVAIGYISKNGNEFTDWLDFNKQVLTAPVETTESRDNLAVLFVIGESFIRSHSPLYGYPLPTTPSQSSEFDKGNLIPFSNIWSTAKTTSPSIKNLLNLSDISQGETLAQGAFFPLILKNAGYDVKMFDHQKVNGTFCDASLLSFLYNDLLLKECYSYVADPQDGDLDNDFIERESDHLYDSNDKQFYIVHLSGQHFPFDKIPENDARFKRFSPADYTSRNDTWLTENKRQLIADYDNITLYNDFVIGNMLKKLEDKNAIVVYFSDHGEEVYDYRDNAGRAAPPAAGLPDAYKEAMYHLPFWIWISPELKQADPRLYETIEKYSARFGSLDDIGNAMLNIAGVKSPFYIADRDILSMDYKVPESLKTVEGLTIERKL